MAGRRTRPRAASCRPATTCCSPTGTRSRRPWPQAFGGGCFRGQVVAALARYKFNRFLSGHLLAEYFQPDGYYLAEPRRRGDLRPCGTGLGVLDELAPRHRPTDIQCPHVGYSVRGHSLWLNRRGSCLTTMSPAPSVILRPAERRAAGAVCSPLIPRPVERGVAGATVLPGATPAASAGVSLEMEVMLVAMVLRRCRAMLTPEVGAILKRRVLGVS